MVIYHHEIPKYYGTFWLIQLSILPVAHLQMLWHKLRNHVIKSLKEQLYSYFVRSFKQSI